MTDLEREQLFKALRGPLQYDTAGNLLMDEVADEDLRVIEPVVNEFIAQAEMRGRVQLLLEFAAKVWERRQRAA